MDSIGLYIHFPFCASKCAYCDFNSYAGVNDRQIDYFQALLKEIKLQSNPKQIVDTIYIGGGTPSIMFDGCITTLLSEIRKNFSVDIDAEITIECNPNSVTLSKAQEWKDAGVNRVSIGLQSTNENLLKLIGRVHSKNDYLDAVDKIRTVGIENINTDCLIGLPKQKLSHVKHTLNILNKLNIPHISVYSLILEDGTSLKNQIELGKLKLPKEEKTLSMYNYAYKFLRENGYSRYEVSNFSKKNYECRHNLHTWQMHKYLGFGAGAHSYLDGYRFSNVCSIDEYVNSLSKNKLPVDSKEKISKDEELEETLMLGLRTKYGVDLVEIKKEFHVDLLKSKHETISNLISLGLINLVYDRIIATDNGFAVLNKIILELVA